MTTDSLTEVTTALKDLVFALNASRVDYLIGGSLASSIQGEFRATNDIDILARLDPATLDLLLKELSLTFIVDPIAAQNALRSEKTFNIFHEVTCLKVDFFTKVDAYRSEQLGRAIEIT